MTLHSLPANYDAMRLSPPDDPSEQLDGMLDTTICVDTGLGVLDGVPATIDRRGNIIEVQINKLVLSRTQLAEMLGDEADVRSQETAISLILSDLIRDADEAESDAVADYERDDYLDL